MNPLRLFPLKLCSLAVAPLVIGVTACNTVNVPLSPHRIDVQQGNALEQDAVDKLKPGMTRSQVRFLLGSPTIVDPFRENRWDYVYNYRKAGKLSEKKRLSLVFDGDLLSRIEGEGLALAEKGSVFKPTEQESLGQGDRDDKQALTSDVPNAVAASAETATATQAASAQSPGQTSADPVPSAPVTGAPTPVPPPVRSDQVVKASGQSLDETSIVPPLAAPKGQSPERTAKPVAVNDVPPEPVALQPESNVEAVKADVMPAFPGTAQAAQGSESDVLSALNAWAEAWRAKNEDAYVAAYAGDFRPQGGISRAEWEKRRRLLLGLSRNIDLKIESASVEIQGDNRALVIFNQFYRSETYQDAVAKQMRFVLVDGRWLIEEEKVLGPLSTKK